MSGLLLGNAVQLARKLDRERLVLPQRLRAATGLQVEPHQGTLCLLIEGIQSYQAPRVSVSLVEAPECRALGGEPPERTLHLGPQLLAGLHPPLLKGLAVVELDPQEKVAANERNARSEAVDLDGFERVTPYVARGAEDSLELLYVDLKRLARGQADRSAIRLDPTLPQRAVQAPEHVAQGGEGVRAVELGPE